jgi:hypothetical protein
LRARPSLEPTTRTDLVAARTPRGETLRAIELKQQETTMPIFRNGQDFIVNTITARGQFSPAITELTDGRFIVTWNSYDGNIPSQGHIRGRLYNANGTPAGNDFLIDGTDDGDNHSAAVTALADGRFVVTWRSEDTDEGDGSCILARLFDSSGTHIDSDFIVNTTAMGNQSTPAITTLADGRFLVTWQSNDTGDGSAGCIRGRLFSAGGVPAGNDFIVNTTATQHQFEPAVTGLSDGRFVVTWQSADPGDGSGACIRGRVFNGAGVPTGNDFIVNTTATGDQFAPSVTGLADGRFVVTWRSDDSGDGDGTCLRGRILNANGEAAGDDFIINTTGSGLAQVPSVTALADGRFVVTWRAGDDGVGDGSQDCIRARLYNVDGSAAGDDFVVNTTGMGDQAVPSVTGLADGSFVVAWQSNDDGDGSLTCIRAVRFAPTTFNGTSGADVWQGGNLADEIRGFESDDTLSGLAGDDEIEGDGGNDTLIGGAGTDQLRGGDGDDTAVFGGGFDAYSFGIGRAEVFVIGPDGFDALTGIEHLQFDDGRVDLDDGSALFDTLYYVAQNPDVFHAGVNPLDHFNTLGWREGRDPAEEFDTRGYLAVNPDVAAAGINPLDHYHQNGWREERDPSAGFDTTLYLMRNPDVAAAGVDPLAHYLQLGRAEGREAYNAVGPTVNGFDAQYYLFQNPDVAAAGIDPHFHFNVVGWTEGRDPNGWFDTAGYLAHNDDVAAAGINPFDHYMAIGWTEGRDASARFDTAGYLATNPDVAAAGMNPLDHFLQLGIYEGRQAVNDGMWS